MITLAMPATAKMKTVPSLGHCVTTPRQPCETAHHGVYKLIKRWALKSGVQVTGFCNHALRSTAAINALEHGAEITEVQEWFGHSNNISTTRLYDRRKMRPGRQPYF